MEIIIFAIGAMILTAVAIRLISWFFKLVYEISPFILIWAIILLLMYAVETNHEPYNMKDNNATIARTTED